MELLSRIIHTNSLSNKEHNHIEIVKLQNAYDLPIDKLGPKYHQQRQKHQK